jgi:hypothetical protein
MRLSGIDTFEAGNAFLPSFMEKYNARFAKDPFDDRDVHRVSTVLCRSGMTISTRR